MDPEIPYLLLTPGPLSTSRTVRQAMLTDYSTWDVDYNAIVTRVREGIVRLATEPPGPPLVRRDGRTSDRYTCTLVQGSGTFAVEATIGSTVAADGKILIVNNGAYGKRMVETAARLRIDCFELAHEETDPPDLERMRRAFEGDGAITHVAMAHCETTTGMLNPADEVGKLARQYGKKYILDAMSSFAGVPMTMESVGADFLISSANKCVQGVPGFGFVVASRAEMESLEGRARSLSLDLWDQWQEMEAKGGKWRYTSPTHVVCAFAQALKELDEEGGVAARHRRYSENQRRLVEGMEAMGFRTLIPRKWQSPIITSFHNPIDPKYSFNAFYDKLKARRFVIYPGKVSRADCFRIGTIGHVFPEDIDLLLVNIREVVAEMGVKT
jgi:2-aminoethylphosphonate-pyruvate transaminase